MDKISTSLDTVKITIVHYICITNQVVVYSINKITFSLNIVGFSCVEITLRINDDLFALWKWGIYLIIWISIRCYLVLSLNWILSLGLFKSLGSWLYWVLYYWLINRLWNGWLYCGLIIWWFWSLFDRLNNLRSNCWRLYYWRLNWWRFNSFFLWLLLSQLFFSVSWGVGCSFRSARSCWGH